MGIRGRKQLHMLEMWNLVAVVGKSIKFINYRSKKIENQIKLRDEENNTSAEPLWVKVNENQTFMLVAVDCGGVYLINLVTFMYNYIKNDNFLIGREDEDEDFFNVFSGLEDQMKAKVEQDKRFAKVTEKKKKRLVRREIKKTKRPILNRLFDVSYNFEHLVYIETKTGEDNLETGRLLYYKLDKPGENSTFEIDMTNPSIHFKFSHHFKLSFKTKFVRVKNNGRVVLCSNNHVTEVLQMDGSKSKKTLKAMKKSAKRVPMIATEIQTFDLSRDDQRLFVTLSNKFLNVFQIEEDKMGKRTSYKLEMNPLCFGISSNGKVVGMGALAGENNIFLELKKDSACVPMAELLKEEEIYKENEEKVGESENVFEKVRVQITKEAIGANLVKLKRNSLVLQKKQRKEDNYKNVVETNKYEFGIPNMNRKGGKIFRTLKNQVKMTQELFQLLKETHENLQDYPSKMSFQEFRKSTFKLYLKKIQFYLKHVFKKKTKLKRYFKDCYRFTQHICKNLEKENVKKITIQLLVKELDELIAKESEAQSLDQNENENIEQNENIEDDSDNYQTDSDGEEGSKNRFDEENEEEEEDSGEEEESAEETEGEEEETEDEEEEEELI